MMQLEVHGKLSASRLDDLAKILKTICRYDVAKKVQKFIQQQLKGQKGQTIDHHLEMCLLQCKSLLELKKKAEMCYKRVEEVVVDAQTTSIQRKFLYAITQEAVSCKQTVCSTKDQNHEFLEVSVYAIMSRPVLLMNWLMCQI